MNVTLISEEAAELGEGPRLDARTGEVLWVDIMAGHLYRCRWDGGRLHTIAMDEDGTVTVLAEPESHHQGRTRMNDGACDPQGRFWAGSMAYDERPGAGTLY